VQDEVPFRPGADTRAQAPGSPDVVVPVDEKVIGERIREQLVGRKQITRDECRRVQGQLQDDLENRRLTPVSLDLDCMFYRGV
jgi:hypothetical protein